MEKTLKVIEDNIASANSLINYYQKEAEKNLKYKSDQVEKTAELEKEYEELRNKLGLPPIN